MAEDFCIRVVEAEALEEFLHRYLLCEGTGVGRFTIGIESALIADGDAVGVVVSGVGADLSLRARRFVEKRFAIKTMQQEYEKVYSRHK